jgi:hypothetical protein
VGPVVAPSLGSLVVVRRYSSLGCTVGVGYSRGGGCDVAVVIPVMVVSAVVVVAVFFLVATCRFKDPVRLV